MRNNDGKPEGARHAGRMATLIGKHRRTEAKPSDGDLYLVVLAGTEVGRVHQAAHKTTSVIGRDDDVEIRIIDDGVSRRHAELRSEGGLFRITDLGSRNGTSVNGEPVQAPRELRQGDRVEVGFNTVLRVSRGDPVELEYAQKMYQAALKDGLTGAYNRRYLDQRLGGEVAFAIRHQRSLSALMLDVDHFKRINDTHGHANGDVVLRQVAAVVSSSIRTEDLFVRYGGEEFVVLCRDTGEPQGLVLAERIRNTVASRPIAIGELSVHATISIGIADLASCAEKNGEALLQTADSALYRAKESGRNRVVCSRSG